MASRFPTTATGATLSFWGYSVALLLAGAVEPSFGLLTGLLIIGTGIIAYAWLELAEGRPLRIFVSLGAGAIVTAAALIMI